MDEQSGFDTGLNGTNTVPHREKQLKVGRKGVRHPLIPEMRFDIMGLTF